MNKVKIRKAVIPVAGWGTRFLPATKVQPKEMLPILNVPVVQHVVELAVKAGIEEIILVTGSSKRAVEDHFDYNYALESHLKQQGKTERLREIRRIAEMANFVYVRQKGPYGNGTPVLTVKDIVGDEAFLLMWGDGFIYSEKDNPLKDLFDIYEKEKTAVLACREVEMKDVEKYGIIDASFLSSDYLQVNKIIEKPKMEDAPSNIASLGIYILSPDIFEILENQSLGKDGELWLTDAIAELLKHRPVYAKLLDIDYYDIGSTLGYLKANLDMALKNPNLKDDLLLYLKNKLD